MACRSVNKAIDPLGLPTVTADVICAIFTHVVRLTVHMSVRSHFQLSKSRQVKQFQVNIIVTGGTVGLAEGINNDTCILWFYCCTVRNIWLSSNLIIFLSPVARSNQFAFQIEIGRTRWSLSWIQTQSSSWSSSSKIHDCSLIIWTETFPASLYWGAKNTK